MSTCTTLNASFYWSSYTTVDSDSNSQIDCCSDPSTGIDTMSEYKVIFVAMVILLLDYLIRLMTSKLPYFIHIIRAQVRPRNVD